MHFLCTDLTGVGRFVSSSGAQRRLKHVPADCFETGVVTPYGNCHFAHSMRCCAHERSRPPTYSVAGTVFAKKCEIIGLLLPATTAVVSCSDVSVVGGRQMRRTLPELAPGGNKS